MPAQHRPEGYRSLSPTLTGAGGTVPRRLKVSAQLGRGRAGRFRLDWTPSATLLELGDRFWLLDGKAKTDAPAPLSPLFAAPRDRDRLDKARSALQPGPADGGALKGRWYGRVFVPRSADDLVAEGFVLELWRRTGYADVHVYNRPKGKAAGWAWSVDRGERWHGPARTVVSQVPILRLETAVRQGLEAGLDLVTEVCAAEVTQRRRVARRRKRARK